MDVTIQVMVACLVPIVLLKTVGALGAEGPAVKLMNHKFTLLNL